MDSGVNFMLRASCFKISHFYPSWKHTNRTSLVGERPHPSQQRTSAHLRVTCWKYRYVFFVFSDDELLRLSHADICRAYQFNLFLNLFWWTCVIYGTQRLWRCSFLLVLVVKFVVQRACHHCMLHLPEKWWVLISLGNQTFKYSFMLIFWWQICLLLKVCDPNSRFASDRISFIICLPRFWIFLCFYRLALVTSCARDDQGCTPLHIAAARNRGVLVDELLKFGAGWTSFFVLSMKHSFIFRLHLWWLYRTCHPFIQ